MPAKSVKVGIKFYFMTDSKRSFAYSFRLFNEKCPCMKDNVLNLVEDFGKKNHTLYMDNFYNSKYLFEKLKEKGIYSCGTV
jgi:hypothetical protein